MTISKILLRGLGCAVLSVACNVRAEDVEPGETPAEPAEYVKEVAAGDIVLLTAEEVSAAAGLTFVKTGKGTLVVDDVMANFTGDIIVRDGYYVAKTRGALGTADGETYANGGTLVNEVAADATNGTAPAFPSEHIHIQGVGMEPWGALQNKTHCVDFARKVTMEGDATINTRTKRFDFRATTFNMNGHKLTVDAHEGGFYFVAMTIQNMGDIDQLNGYLEFQAGFATTLAERTITVADNASFGFFSASSWLASSIVFGTNVVIKSANDAFKYAGTDNRAVISGPVTLRGMMRNEITKNNQVQFRGKMTGPGGIVGGQGGYVQIFGSENDFTGGLAIKGVVENGNPVGGVVLYSNGAVPSGEGARALALTNATLQLRDKTRYDLPELVLDGRTTVSNMATVTETHVRGLKKTGAGELDVFGPMSVAGDASIDGTLRLATKVPAVVSGLKWNYKNQQAGITAYADQGIDATGVGYAYKSWPSGTDIYMNYSGYICVPGEDGEEVTCNWMTSMARSCKVTIGGVLCCEFNDNKNVKDGITVGYVRLAMYKPVTLKAGWQPISISLGNWWNTTRGPQDNSSLGWPANFGIGVDWQCRSVTNTANYAKLLDPGDGSFLRASLDENARTTLLVESRYRATFAGDVAFGPGAVLDIGDAAPYWPLTVPSLTGLPMVKNGAVTVTSTTWTLRTSDLLDADGKAYAKPLTLDGDATLAFPAGTVTLDISAADAAELANMRKKIDCPLVADTTAFAANTFVLSDTLRATGWYLVAEDNVLILRRSAGMVFVVR